MRVVTANPEVHLLRTVRDPRLRLEEEGDRGGADYGCGPAVAVSGH